MEWLADLLLCEEIEAPLRHQTSKYSWAEVSVLRVLTYREHPPGGVHTWGQYSLTWRERIHAGHAAPQSQGKRFMTRWIAARGDQSPMRPDHKRQATLTPLAHFLRDYASERL